MVHRFQQSLDTMCIVSVEVSHLKQSVDYDVEAAKHIRCAHDLIHIMHIDSHGAKTKLFLYKLYNWPDITIGTCY